MEILLLVAPLSCGVHGMKMPVTSRKKYSIEYTIRSSPHILFEFLSTPSGLAQWFADDVDSFGNQFTFIWEGNRQKASVMELVENHIIRFHWADSEPEEFFEFRITTTEITGETVLQISDFGDPTEYKDSQLLWDSQVHELRKRLGGL